MGGNKASAFLRYLLGPEHQPTGANRPMVFRDEIEDTEILSLPYDGVSVTVLPAMHNARLAITRRLNAAIRKLNANLSCSVWSRRTASADFRQVPPRN